MKIYKRSTSRQVNLALGATFAFQSICRSVRKAEAEVLLKISSLEGKSWSSGDGKALVTQRAAS